MMRVPCDSTKLLPEFLYYWLSSPAGQHYLFSRVSQVGVPQLQTPLTSLRQAVLAVPPLLEQQTIVRILGTLDDKIELNQEMNETLEAIARTLFKSWFVDFDPVRAKAKSGKPPSVPREIGAKFPALFSESRIGLIPQGWGVGPIVSRALLLSGGTPKTNREDYWNGDVLWCSAKDASQATERMLLATERTITAKGLYESATQLIPALCTVVVARGATTGRMVLLGRPMAINQTCYAVESTTDTPFGLYCRLRHEIDGLVHAAHGSVFDTITTSTFAASRCV